MLAVIATNPALAQDYCTFGTFGGRLELPNAILLPLGLAQLPLLPSVQPPYDMVPNFEIVVPLLVYVPEAFGTYDAHMGSFVTALYVSSTPRKVSTRRAEEIWVGNA